MPDKNPLLRMQMAAVPPRPTKISVVEACTLLNTLTQEERQEVAAQSFTAYAERGELIWSAGAPSEYIAIIGSGFVKMTKTSPGGHEAAMELVGPGQCIGLFAAIEGRAFPLNAAAITNCWYLKVPTRLICSLYESSSSFKDQILRNLMPRLRKAHEMMSRLSSGRVEERVAAVLFLLADSYGIQHPEGLCIEVPLTRQDISEMAGTTVETCIRVLSKWQKEGIVSTDHHIITLLNEPALQDMLTFGVS